MTFQKKGSKQAEQQQPKGRLMQTSGKFQKAEILFEVEIVIQYNKYCIWLATAVIVISAVNNVTFGQS